jgi:hypothetical protein
LTFTFQGRSSVSWRWRTFMASKHQLNDRKCWKNSRTHPRRSSPNNPWARRHRWDQLRSLPDLNRKFKHAPHCDEVCSPTLDKWSKAAARNMCLELREKANEDPTFISRIITGDESWIYGYDPETKQQSSQWKSPQSPRAKRRDEKDRNFDATTTGSFIMTTRPPARPWKPKSLWLTITTWLSFPIYPIRRTNPRDFALFPKFKIKLKERRFESVWHPKGIASRTRQH